jgi:Fe-S oxidoreductase
MCPSFQVTREEAHTTRGRAHALFEMLEGDVLEKGWRDTGVKEALDLCLSCKGCKADCPTNVDMATYKAEFLSHHYAGRMRPMPAYSMGLIYWWARLAAFAPGLANAVTQTPGLSNVVRALGGLTQERPMPRFADETFKQWFRRRGERNVGGPRVILWPDTFNNHFHPEVARSALEVLEAAGFHVTLPRPSLCCGRPLYDYGFLDLAERQLRQILDALAPDIRAGVPVVGLEPSCVSVFRDEMVNLFPDDEDAKRLKAQTYVFSEFLMRKAKHFQLPKLGGKALVHGHCHHKAVLKLDDELKLFEALGVEVEQPASGCCGLAGSFGFEAGEKHAVSVKAGERELLPAVRGADADTPVVTGGFSCRTQIEQGTDRQPIHVAELVHQALAHAGVPFDEAPRPRPRGRQALVWAGAAVVGAGLVLAARRVSTR